MSKLIKDTFIDDDGVEITFTPTDKALGFIYMDLKFENKDVYKLTYEEVISLLDYAKHMLLDSLNTDNYFMFKEILFKTNYIVSEYLDIMDMRDEPDLKIGTIQARWINIMSMDIKLTVGQLLDFRKS